MHFDWKIIGYFSKYLPYFYFFSVKTHTIFILCVSLVFHASFKFLSLSSWSPVQAPLKPFRYFLELLWYETQFSPKKYLQMHSETGFCPLCLSSRPYKLYFNSKTKSKFHHHITKKGHLQFQFARTGIRWTIAWKERKTMDVADSGEGTGAPWHADSVYHETGTN